MKPSPVLLCLAVILLTLGCSQKVAFQTSSTSAAAEANAKVTRDPNGNARIKLKVEHLALPQKLTPPKSIYVVWAETPQGRTINLGRLVVGKNRQGKFQGVTSLGEFRLLITAEDLAAASLPSPYVVLSTDVIRVKKGLW